MNDFEFTPENRMRLAAFIAQYAEKSIRIDRRVPGPVETAELFQLISFLMRYDEAFLKANTMNYQTFIDAMRSES